MATGDSEGAAAGGAGAGAAAQAPPPASTSPPSASPPAAVAEPAPAKPADGSADADFVRNAVEAGKNALRERNRLHARESRKRRKERDAAMERELEALRHSTALVLGYVTRRFGPAAAAELEIATGLASAVAEVSDEDAMVPGMAAFAGMGHAAGGAGGAAAALYGGDDGGSEDGTRKRRRFGSDEARKEGARERNRLNAHRSRMRKKLKAQNIESRLERLRMAVAFIPLALRQRVGVLLWPTVRAELGLPEVVDPRFAVPTVGPAYWPAP